jgi:NADH:quinone reductase (non-electrogenic)
MVRGMASHRVLIIGGGFGGLNAARVLGRDSRVNVTLVDRRNFHTFQPLLYQVATGAISPGDIAQPLRSILRKRANTTVLLGEAVGIDVERREVLLSDGGPVPYDTLVVATGARHSYFGNDQWAPNAPGLKSIDDALEIRRRILIAFEAAEREQNLDRRREWMTFVVIGGGPTGVELAGALGEIAHDTLRRDFRSIHSPDARIILVEALDRILPTYPPGRSRSAEKQLSKLGVDVRTGTRVIDVDSLKVTVVHDGAEEAIPARTTLWAAGVQASTFARRVAEATGAQTDRAGRIIVGPDLAVPGHPEIYALGDAAVQPWKKDRPVPGIAQGAIQSGSWAARAILTRLEGGDAGVFKYTDKGDVAVIGRLHGVTNIRWLGPLGRQGGMIAWMMWLAIHIFYLIGFANRVVVMIRWAWSFFTSGRGTRLITGSPLLPPIEEPAPAWSVQESDATRRTGPVGAAEAWTRSLDANAEAHQQR